MRFKPSHTLMILASLLLTITALTAVASQMGVQEQKRPRRVNGSQQQTPPKTVNSGDEVDEGDVVRVDTQLVSVPAVVTDSTGRPIANLRQDNFQLFEDGKLQTITNFGTDQAPFEIALLLDTSGSTSNDVALIRQAAKSFVESLRPGDRVGVVAFNTYKEGSSKIATVDVLTNLTNDRESLQTAIDNLGSSNGTPYYDALDRVATDIFGEPPREEVRGRRAIVALTDGVDSASESDFATVRAKLTRAGIACYFIQINTEDFVEDRLMRDCRDDGRLTLSQKQLARYKQIFVKGAKDEDYMDFCQMGPFERMSISRSLYNLARTEMNDLSKSSGGRSLVAASLADARAAFARVAADIGTLYSLGYYPSNKARDGKFRTIRLEIRGVRDKTQVRSRDGYFAPRQ
ncbi:MAG TPA: VWA domain-containing protein [Pyrinomonadaceae bacterium]|nr:VWA domain-containing protein [Pyrinomonadaceae bacterium]